MDKIEIVIVTGMSGAGKTTAMAAFENMAYCCIDNYPIALLGAFSEFLKDNTNYQRIAMAVSLADAPKAIRFLNNVRLAKCVGYFSWTVMIILFKKI